MLKGLHGSSMIAKVPTRVAHRCISIDGMTWSSFSG